MEVGGDGTISFVRGQFSISLRPMLDEELNRLFAAHSEEGPRSTNPYTYGDTRFWEGERERERFTVFRLRIANDEYPKVKIDPARVLVRGDSGREYWSLSLAQLDAYYRAYTLGYQGNEYARYRERLDLLRRTLFKNEEVFRGQEKEGFLVFPVLDHDVRQLEVVIQDAVLRFDYRNEPVEAVELTYHFDRQTGRLYRDGRVVFEDSST